MTYVVPPNIGPEDVPPVQTTAELTRAWTSLLGPLTYEERQIWLMFLDPDGVIMPALSKITDLDSRPDYRFVDNLIGLCERLVGTGREGSSFAMLYARPGRRATNPSDRSWARAVAHRAGASWVRMRPMHLANDHDLRPFSADDTRPE